MNPLESMPSAPPPPAAPSIGGGRYALVAKIAEGGMAGVYRAWDSELQVWRAIKVLLPEYVDRKGLRERFEREAKAMAKLDHPNVIRVYDVVTDEALPFMVMELAEGGTLIGWLNAYGQMPARLAASVAEQVAHGLSAAHAAKVIHRDVKPHNVLISTEGLCKITDFGIARVINDESPEGMTRTGSTMGTIGYMAPEQRADAKGVDERADVYSLGALTYKLLTGSIVTDLFLVEHEPVLLDPIPQPLHELILKACFHDRERRYATTEAFVETLGELVPLLPPDPPDTPPLPNPMPEAAPPEDETDPFPEIAVLLRPPMEEAPTGPPAAERVLPYRMPATPAPPRPTPTSLGAAYTMPKPPLSPMPEISAVDSPLSAPSLDRRATPSHRSQTASSVPAPFTPEPAPGRPLDEAPASIRVLAALAAMAWGGLLLLALWGMVSVQFARSGATRAQQDFYATLVEEQRVLVEFGLAGANAATVEALHAQFMKFEDLREEPEKLLAAAEFARSLNTEAHKLPDEPGSARLARVRARNIELSLDRVRAARELWRQRARSGPGRFAIGLGVAPRPQ